MDKEIPKKTVYFVRHGESTHNAKGLHQDGLVELSEQGFKQAEFVAKRFLHIRVDTIIASPFTRARQTAETISAAVNLPIEFNELFVETLPPSEVIGKSKDDPEVISMHEKFRENMDNPQWRYSDEENFQDRIARAKKAVGYLEGINKNSILVVSHGAFIRYMLATMVLGEELKPSQWHRVIRFFHTTNTGITVCKYDTEHRWKLYHWNDVAHLN